MREKEEIEKEIKKLSEERENLSYKIEELKYELNKNKQHFIERKFNKTYYTIANDWGLTYFSELDNNLDIHSCSYNDFNYFHTEDEVKKYLNHIKLSLKILRARDFVNDNWKPDYKLRQFNDVIMLQSKNDIFCPYNLGRHILTFENDDKISEFRKLISDEEIIKFLSF